MKATLNPFAHLKQRWRFVAPDAGQRADLLLLMTLGILIFGSGLGLKDPWPADEPRFALVAKEMVETGEWLFPHRASQLYDHKPPIFMWAVAVVYAATGSIRLAHQLPSLLASLVTLALVYDLGRRLWHRRAGLGAGLALLLIAQFPLQAKTGQIDALATMWTTLGLYGLCRHLLKGPDWRAYALGCFAMGLGIITKGIGFLPLLMLLPWAVIRSLRWPRLPALRVDWRWLLGPIFLVGAIGLWLVPMLVQVETSDDPELAAYRDEILIGQTAERYTSLKGHQKPLWYYPGQVIPTLWLPLALFLPWLVPAWWRRIRRGDPRYLLLLCWIGLVVLFFTFSSGKRGVYILPAAPAFALAVGPLAAGLERLRGIQRTAFGLLALITSVVLLGAVGGWLGLEWAIKLETRQGIRPWGVLTALALVGLAAMVKCKTRTGVNGLAVLFFGLWLLYGWWVYPLINPQRVPADLMAHASEHIGPKAELGLLGWKEQLVLFADRPITHWGFVEDHLAEFEMPPLQHTAAAWLDAPSEDRWLLLSDRWLAPCFSSEAGLDLGERHRRRWFLIDHNALTGACGPGTEGWPVEPLPFYRTDWMATNSTAAGL